MATTKKRIEKLERNEKLLLSLVKSLAEALHQHARNDCAPDEAIPWMKKLAHKAKRIAK